MITILEDQHQYQPPPPDALVGSDKTDYVPLRMAIRRALDSHTPLTVYITHPLLLHWFKDLRTYPGEVVVWKSADPAEEFTDFFGFAPPSLFTRECIVQLDLTTLIPPQPGISVEPITWILSQKLDELWGHSHIYPDHLAHLAAWAIQQSPSIPYYVLPLVQAQLDEWATQNPTYGYLHAATLRKDSTRLLLHAMLHRYDRQWLQQQGWHDVPVIDIDIDTRTIHDVCIEIVHEHEALIVSYWKRFIATATIGQSPELSMASMLNQVSGLSMAELSALSNFLDRFPETLNADLLQRIAERFAFLPAASDKVQQLATRITPDIPTIPDESWSVEQWLRWATQEYMPYFAWTIRHQQPRDHQQVCAAAFADWLIHIYPAWLNSETSPVIINQYQQMRQILDHDKHALVVWLIVDGMTWWQGDYVRKACKQQGLYPQSQTIGIAALPSITSISKRMLVTGMPATDTVSPTIAQAAREQLGRSGIAHHVCSTMQEGIGVVNTSTSIRCLVVLFNMLDKVAHDTPTFTDNAGIRGYLDDLADGLAQMMNLCVQQGRAFHVLIGSDHGSTLLPDDAVCLPLPREAHDICDIWQDDTTGQAEKHSPRAVVVTGVQHLPPDITSHWYILERTRYQLAQHYLVPRGYAYVTHRPTGWTHGGLTPEEVIVPLLHLAPEQLRIEPVEVRLSGSLRTNQDTELVLELVNVNQMPIEVAIIHIDGLASPLTIEHIAALSTYRMEITVPPISTRNTELAIRWTLRCHIAGTPYDQQGQHTLPIRRLQVEDTSIDDFFD